MLQHRRIRGHLNAGKKGQHHLDVLVDRFGATHFNQIIAELDESSVAALSCPLTVGTVARFGGLEPLKSREGAGGVLKSGGGDLDRALVGGHVAHALPFFKPEFRENRLVRRQPRTDVLRFEVSQGVGQDSRRNHRRRRQDRQ